MWARRRACCEPGEDAGDDDAAEEGDGAGAGISGVRSDGSPPPTAFESVDDCVAHFRPLLLMELHEELRKSREESRAYGRESSAATAYPLVDSAPRVVPPPPRYDTSLAKPLTYFGTLVGLSFLFTTREMLKLQERAQPEPRLWPKPKPKPKL